MFHENKINYINTFFIFPMKLRKINLHKNLTYFEPNLYLWILTASIIIKRWRGSTLTLSSLRSNSHQDALYYYKQINKGQFIMCMYHSFSSLDINRIEIFIPYHRHNHDCISGNYYPIIDILA